MASVFTLKALGLNIMPNQLEVPPGSLTIASNVNIARTDVIEPRRGFKVYGDAMGSSSDRAKQLISYKLRILRHFSNILQFDSTGTGTFKSFNGSVTEAVPGLRIKSVEANGNLYFTTSDGIKKISALNANDLTTLSGVVVDAGGIPAVDISGRAVYAYGNETGFLPQDSAVSYRVVWGYKDNNGNLILGAPSQLDQVYSPILNNILPDYMQVLNSLDNIGALGSLINAQDYVNVLGLPSNATGLDLYNALLALTKKLDNNLFFADNYDSLGAWNASTNTPTIRDNVRVINDTYIVNVAGTQNLGVGSNSYLVNDIVVYDGTTWNKDADYVFKGSFNASEQFLGQWNANSNLPSLVDGNGVLNSYYRVNVPGTQNLGSGAQTFATGDYVKYNGSTWLKDVTSRFYLQNGIGNEGDLYLITSAGSVNFNIGGVSNPISLNINDFLVYHNNQYVVLTGSILTNNKDVTQASSLKFLNYWNASTNTPLIFDTIVKNGDFYTVSVGGTQDLGAGSITFVAGDRVLFNDNNWTIVNYNNLGAWNASTNTPALVNGTGIPGNYYTVNVAGTQNLGAGPVTYAINDRIMYVAGQWVVNTFNISTTAPLTIESCNISSGVCTITFSSGNPTNYFVPGQSILLSGGKTVGSFGFTPKTGTLDGVHTIASVTTTTITFNTTATGDANGNVIVDSTAAINSSIFGSIPPPPIPATFPTNADLTNLQKYLQNIITQLLLQPTQIISNTLSQQFISTLLITNSYNVLLTITIPSGITPAYFFQIYRSQVFSATGIQVLNQDVVPNDELQQVYEAFPTAAELAAGTLQVLDIVPDNFRGANLYTNASTGEGILQANTPPPFATDINTFKGSTFYSNTRVLQYMALSLLGVQNMITDFNNGALTNLKSAITFGTLSGSSLTNTGSSTLIGNIGTSPGSSVIGFPPGTFTGTLNLNDTTAIQAQIDATSAYNSAQALPGATDLSGTDLGGLTLSPGIYKFTSSAQLTGTLTLNGGGNSAAIWVFQIGSTLTTASASSVVLINGANANNITWAVGSSATLGTTTAFQGNIISEVSSTLNTGTTLVGRVFSLTGSTSLDSNIITNSLPSSLTPPSITISTTTGTQTYTFVTGLPEIFTVTCNAGSTLAASGTASYFDVNGGNNITNYRFYYQIGTATAPVAAGRTLVPILALAGDTNVQIASKTRDVFNTVNLDFIASSVSNVVTVDNIIQGYTTPPVAATTGFTFTVTQAGRGENAALHQVLLSTNISPAIAVQETALSLTRVVNLNASDGTYIYYTSGSNQVPGQMLIQARNLGITQFFINTNNANTGASFSPSVAPNIQINNIATGNPSVVTTSTPHGLANLDYIFISGSNSTPSIDGYQQINYISTTSFSVNVNVTVAGTKGGISPYSTIQASSNDAFPNRIFYSKLQQPEAVPTLNYFDVGAKDKAILRIYPLRDSLFIFKQDGIYRISGESIPFNLGLFDSSCILVAPDSVSSVDNVIYAWSRQGISSVTESGTRNISRPIDVALLPLSSSSYTKFVSSTWGTGYESDKSYTVYTITKPTDQIAQIGYKYNTLTNAWTTVNKDSVCGVINFVDDRMYLGAGDINFIEQERKNYDRTDFADREYTANIQPNSMGTTIILNSVANMAANDVIVQSQPFSIYNYNAILKTLDIDAGVNVHNFFSTLGAIAGDNLRVKLDALANKLDLSNLGFNNYKSSIGSLSGTITSVSTGPLVNITSNAHGLITGRTILLSGINSSPVVNGEFTVTVIDTNNFTVSPGFTVLSPGTTGTFSTVISDFADLQVCYNKLITMLNTDTIVQANNFLTVTDYVNEEALILSVNRAIKSITIGQAIPFVQGLLTSYKGIDSVVVYSPYLFGGDPVSLKHIRESQILFDNLAFTGGTISYASDLLPEFQEVPFLADGPGLFGLSKFGSGFFGGLSDSAPIRTYIPRQCQRCRYLIVKFEHTIARDKWALNGITLTGETQLSTRSYR